MTNRNIVVIGASAGGIEALQQLVSALPGNLGAALLIVLPPGTAEACCLRFGQTTSVILSVAGEGVTRHPFHASDHVGGKRLIRSGRRGLSVHSGKRS